MGTSLFNITNVTPGVALASATTGRYQARLDELTRMAWCTLSGRTCQVCVFPRLSIPRTSVSGDTTYVGSLIFGDDGGIRFYLHPTNDSHGFSSSGPQLTDLAEENLGMAVRLVYGDTLNANHHTTYKWEVFELVDSDTNEPYLFTAQSVTAAGDTNNSALRSATDGAAYIEFLLVDRTHDLINFDTLETVDAPEAPTAPTLTAQTTSITVTLSADPTSDETIDSRDLQWKRTADPDTSYTVVDSITSPHTIASLAAETEYEVQWRAVSSAGDGAWSASRTITTPAVESTYTIGDTLRLDSIADLDSIFDRFYTGSSSGRWAVDTALDQLGVAGLDREQIHLVRMFTLRQVVVEI